MPPSLDIQAFVNALGRVLGAAKKPVALHEPDFGEADFACVQDCLRSGWVSSAGEYVGRFEQEITSFLGGGHGVAVVNGTAALQVCLELAGVRPGDEVLVPSLTFVATANAVSYCQAMPHFVESDEASLGVDPLALEQHLAQAAELRAGVCYNRATGRPIRALLPMHTIGHPVDLDPLLALCERYRLVLVEDAAESLGSLYKGRATGRFGRLAALSFNGNKIVTTGGGGMILTDDAKLAGRARHRTTTAKLAHRWRFDHDEVGYNHRLPNLNAALGCGQLRHLAERLAKKRALAERYRAALTEVAGVRLVKEPSYARSNYWLNTVLLDPEVAEQRDSVLHATHEQGFLTRPLWTPMHLLPMYRDCPRMALPVAEDLFRRAISLPSSAFL